MGVTRRLKEENPNIECISMQPDSPFHGLEGLKHMATAIVPAIYDPKSPTATSKSKPKPPTRWPSASPAPKACSLASPPPPLSPLRSYREEQAALGKDAVIVTILPDAADKYLSERFWEE